MTNGPGGEQPANDTPSGTPRSAASGAQGDVPASPRQEDAAAEPPVDEATKAVPGPGGQPAEASSDQGPKDEKAAPGYSGVGGPATGGPGYSGPGYSGPGYSGPGYAAGGYPGPTGSGAWLPPPSPPPWASTLSAQVRALRRSRRDRVVAGVAGGIAERLGIDPLLVRVVIVVLSFFGGTGILLYAAGWLLIPDEGTNTSVIEQAVGSRRDGRGSTLLLAGGLALLVLATAASVLSGSWDGAIVLGLLALGAAFLLRRREEGRPPVAGNHPGAPIGEWSPPDAGSGVGYGAAGDPAAGGYTPQSGYTGAAGYEGQLGYAGQSGYATGYDPASPTAGYGYGRGYDFPSGYEAQWRATTTAPARPARPKSVLFPVTLSLALVMLGFIGVFDVASGRNVPAATYIATALGVVGLGLVLGTWFGRSRGLVVLGFALALSLVPASAAHQWQGPSVDVFRALTTVDQVHELHVEHGAGSLEYDLSAVNFSGRTARMSVDLGAGQIRIMVPNDVAVKVSYDVGAGDVSVFDVSSGGLGLQDVIEQEGTADAGQLELDLNVGVGEVEVLRAQA